jgi:hypothetical protein
MRNRAAAIAAAVVALLALQSPAVVAQDIAPAQRTVSQRLAEFGIPELWTLGNRPQRLESLADVLGVNTYAFVIYALPPKVLAEDFRRFLQTAQRARVDQQIGSGTAATRTGLTTLLGFALESGAVSQTFDQQVGTLRANADGLLRFLSNQEVVPTCGDDTTACRPAGFLKDIDVGATFSIGDAGSKTLGGTSAASGAPVEFTALLDTQQFTGLTVRYAVQNSRDVRSPEYRARWAEWLQQNRAALGAAGTALLTDVKTVVNRVQRVNAAGEDIRAGQDSQYGIWLAATIAKLQAAASPEAAEVALAAQLDDLLAKMRALDRDFDARMEALSDTYLRYLALRRDLSRTLVTDPAMTVEYNYARPLLEPKLHVVKVAWAFSPGNQRGTPGLSPAAAGFQPRLANPGTITVNASVAYFNDPQPTTTDPSQPADPSHWKSAQLAAQFDRPLGPGDSAARLSVGAYYQYQFSPGVIVAPAGATFLQGTSIPLSDAGRQVLGEKGSLAAAQLLLTLRLGSSGLKVPIGVSWASRTELTPGHDVRGHIGFTFDTTPLLLMSGLR